MLEQTVDQEVSAYYLQVSDAAVSRTIEVAADVLVDVDEAGRPVGIEIIGHPRRAATNLQVALARFEFPQDARILLGTFTRGQEHRWSRPAVAVSA